MTNSISHPEKLYLVVNELDLDQGSEFSKRLDLALFPMRLVTIY